MVLKIGTFSEITRRELRAIWILHDAFWAIFDNSPRPGWRIFLYRTFSSGTGFCPPRRCHVIFEYPLIYCRKHIYFCATSTSLQQIALQCRKCSAIWSSQFESSSWFCTRYCQSWVIHIWYTKMSYFRIEGSLLFLDYTKGSWTKVCK